MMRFVEVSLVISSTHPGWPGMLDAIMIGLLPSAFTENVMDTAEPPIVPVNGDTYAEPLTHATEAVNVTLAPSITIVAVIVESLLPMLNLMVPEEPTTVPL